MMEPGIIGILRPILLMPDGINELLSSEQLRAIVAHEMCHVRRRDNLTGAYDFKVKWGPEPNDLGAPAPWNDLPADPGGAVLIDGIRRQLGLQVQSQQRVVRVLVVERVVQPADLPDLPKSVVIDPKVSDRYVGHYAWPGRRILRVTRDGDHVRAQLPGQLSVPYFAKNQREFFAKLVDAQAIIPSHLE